MTFRIYSSVIKAAATAWVLAIISQSPMTSFGYQSTFLLPKNNNSVHRRRPHVSSSTALQVSELHVPGYAQSKLPFILKDEDLQQLSPDGGYMTMRRIQERSYSEYDSESMIPYLEGHLIHKTRIPIFSQEECQSIIDEAERVASQIEWTKNRHGNYPTTDLPLVELPETLSFLKLALVERIYPLLRTQFGMYLPDPTKLRLADGFVVKYDAEKGQKELKPHRDGSVLSFNIALNPASEFEGGGTWFASLDDAVKIDQGQVVSHSSALLHGGHGITTGKRYILVGFVILEGYDGFSMRFYNQVRNM
jgi:hypothetical protein